MLATGKGKATSPFATGLGRIGTRGEDGPHPLFESLACLTCAARKSDICGGLDNDEIRDLATASHRIPLKQGETLVWDGDAAQYSYVITRGTLRAQKASEDGRRQILDFLFAGQFIGIPSGATYHFDAEALTDAEVCRFDRRTLENLMAKYPAVEKGYRAGTARQLETAYDHAYALGRRTAMERVAAFLLDLHASSCPKTSTGVLKLPMTRSDIADFLGLTLETVSRAFSRVKSLGVIRLPSPQEVEIRDVERLKALAGTASL
jgi:CRP/FNR family transcriptional regulator, anaerobic regulatory protein